MADVNEYFYDSQTRRFIIQFIRLCSGFQVEYGGDTLKTVPVIYGDPSRQAAHVLRRNSENVLNTVPMMAAYVTDLKYDRNRMQEPNFVDKKHVRMRKLDEASGQLTTEQGNAFTIERLMPVPYILKMKLDIWTSNTTQKLQLIEQIAPLFNPSFEIQSNDNYFDWTSLSVVNLEDVSWSSRSVSASATDEIDVATMTFNIPIWLSPPSKVKKLGVIKRIITSIYDMDNHASLGFDDHLLMGQRIRLTPLNFNVMLVAGGLTLHRGNEIVDPDNDEIGVPVTIGADPKLPWDLVFDRYSGDICDGISKVVLTLPDEITEISGTVTRDDADRNRLIFVVDTDTIPTNDLAAIDAIIDPLRSGPGTGLAAAAIGQRYLILDNIGDAGDAGSAAAWRGTGGEELVARTNDIIEYDGTKWVVSFVAGDSVGQTHFMVNLTTQIQYSWALDRWVKSYEGEYVSGTWDLIY